MLQEEEAAYSRVKTIEMLDEQEIIDINEKINVLLENIKDEYEITNVVNHLKNLMDNVDTQIKSIQLNTESIEYKRLKAKRDKLYMRYNGLNIDEEY